MKKLLIGKIIGLIGLCLLAVGVSYFVSYALEKGLYNDINLLVTFEDTKEFTLENYQKMDEKEALTIYPYVFVVENKEKGVVKFDMVIKDTLDNLSRSDINYILYLKDKEVKRGSLSDLKNDILYSGTIKSKSKDTYKVYMYLNETKENATYKYSVLLNAK